MQKGSYKKTNASGHLKKNAESLHSQEDPPKNNPIRPPEIYSFLVVEDEPGIRLYIKYCLLDHFKDAHIIEAEDGEKAYAILKNIKPSVLITDLDMPVMDGYELLSKVSKFSEWDVPVLVVSGRVKHPISSNETMRRFKKWSTLKKPFSQQALIKSIQNLIDTKP